MNPKLLLNKAVTQALANGWDIFDAQRDKRATWPPSAENVTVTESSDGRQGWDLFIASPHIYEPIADRWDAEDLIFDHGFAKALWGTNIVNHTDKILPAGTLVEYEDYPQAWQYHLMLLAISDDRWAYLAEHLK